MQKNMIFSGMNSALTDEKNLKMKRNVDSYENNFNFGKYNTLLEIKKELNEEKKIMIMIISINKIICLNIIHI